MKRKKLSSKLILIFVITSLIALSTQAILNYKTSFKMIRNQVQISSEKSLKNMQDEINEYLILLKRNLNSIYKETDFIENLSADRSAKYMKKKYNTLVHDFYIDNIPSSQGIVSIYIYNVNHQCISYYRHADTPKYKYPKDIYEDEVKYNSARVKEYVESKDYDIFISSYYNENRKCNILRFVYKIYVNNRGNLIGYFVCDVDENVFQKKIEKYTYSEDQVVYLQMPGDRVAVVYGNIQKNQRNYLNHVAGKIMENDIQGAKEEQGGNVFFGSENKYHLLAYSIVPESVFANERQMLINYIFLVCLVVVALTVISAIIITNYLTKPLKKLVVTIKRIQAGERNLRAEIESDDEIAELSTNFNTMLSQIEQLIADEYKAQIIRDEAEYKALQAQINPHFLHNTLDTMSGIARMKDCVEVSDLCMALSHMFRYSIDMKEPMSSVQNEITHLSNYLFVMQVRMQDSLHVEWKVKNEHRNLLIPRLSLQPIVENAITHGLKNKRGEKNICIATWDMEDDVMIVVEDNGIGMDEIEINQKLQCQGNEVLHKEESIGLFNINARVKMLFGEAYGINIKSVKGKGSQVFLRVPKNRK